MPTLDYQRPIKTADRTPDWIVFVLALGYAITTGLLNVLFARGVFLDPTPTMQVLFWIAVAAAVISVPVKLASEGRIHWWSSILAVLLYLESAAYTLWCIAEAMASM